MQTTDRAHRSTRSRPRLAAAVAMAALSAVAAPAGAATASTGAATAVGGSCGVQWSVVPSPSPGTVSDELADVDASSLSDVWAVGATVSNREDGAREIRPLTVHWDGSAWTAVPNPVTVDSHVSGVAAIAPDDVWAVGATLPGLSESRPMTMHWNGSSWRRVAAPHIDYANFLAVDGTSSDDVWAVGTVRRFRSRFLAAHWDGDAWTAVRLPESDSELAVLQDVVAVAPDDVWAVGYRLVPDTSPELRTEPVSAHFDGVGWRLVPVPDTTTGGSSELSGLTVTGSSDVWAVGWTTGAAGEQPLALRWTGSAWVRPLPAPGPDSARFHEVAATATGLLAAVGEVRDAERRTKSLAEAGQETGWTVADTPFVPGNDRLFGVTAVPGTNFTWAVGVAGANGPRPTTLVMGRCP